jgi:hypothetical protein
MAFLKDSEYQRRKNTDFLVVHCSATEPSQDIGVEQIREWHIKERKWADVGYHYVVRRDGTRELGRPTWAIGAHVEGHNWQALGICLVGGVDEAGQPANNFTPEQLKTLAECLRFLKRDSYRLAVVCGHHDFDGVKKACPSFDAKAWWAPFDKDVQKEIDSARVGQ